MDTDDLIKMENDLLTEVNDNACGEYGRTGDLHVVQGLLFSILPRLERIAIALEGRP